MKGPPTRRRRPPGAKVAAKSSPQSLSTDTHRTGTADRSLWPAGTLFAAPARTGDPDTSWAAGTGKAEHRARLRADVHRQHQAHPDGLTDDQLAQLLPDDHPPSLVKRRGELVRDGHLVDTGRRRRTRRGSEAIVWGFTRGGTT